MIRLIFTAVLLAALAACSLNSFRGGSGPRVIGESEYCGTASHDSEVHYFDGSSVFQDWINYRSISEFSPSMADNGGVLVVEAGQRPTGGYSVELDRSKTRIENGVLTLGMAWDAPREDAAVSQALTASCVAIKLPVGDYERVRVVDQLDNPRGEARVR